LLANESSAFLLVLLHTAEAKSRANVSEFILTLDKRRRRVPFTAGWVVSLRKGETKSTKPGESCEVPYDRLRVLKAFFSEYFY